MNVLCMGALDEKHEVETFTAVSILQQLNFALREMGIDNIVRLAKDDVDFYLDTKGRSGDLEHAMENFQLEVDHVEAQLFDSLFLVVEHEDDTFRYLIEIRINRTHAVGDYPIEIKVNGLLKTFASADDLATVKEKMAPIFASQDAYDQFVGEQESLFRGFMGNLQLAIQKPIPITDIKKVVKTHLLRPNSPVESQADAVKRLSSSHVPTTAKHRQLDPVFGAYFGIPEAMMYTMLWSTLIHDHQLAMPNASLLDEGGAVLGDAAAFGDPAMALDPDIPVEQITPTGLGGDAGDASGDGGSFFDGIADSFGGGDSGGCASCASCGGCGT